MTVKQISVFLENRQGRLARLCTTLADQGIDMLAISIADTTDYGILRIYVSDHEKAAGILRDAGFSVSITDVIAVAVDDAPGGLAGILRILADEDISVGYLYSLVRRVGHKAVLLLQFRDIESAVQVLRQHEVHMLSGEEITG